MHAEGCFRCVCIASLLVEHYAHATGQADHEFAHLSSCIQHGVKWVFVWLFGGALSWGSIKANPKVHLKSPI